MYVFQFEDDFKNPPEEEYEYPIIWITKKDYWEENECFDDQERGDEFPPDIKRYLTNEMEACFSCRRQFITEMTKEKFRLLFLSYGWEELKDSGN
jgi:hypothetical protein